MNPAIEIAETLDKALKNEASMNLVTHWGRVFECEMTSPDLFIAVAALQAKLLRVIEVLGELPIAERSRGLYVNAARVLLPFVSLNQIFSLNIAALSKLRQNIDVLYLAGDIFPAEAAPSINKLTLDALQTELGALIEGVKSSDMPMQLRHAVEAQLTTLLVAVRGYTTLGQEGFVRLYGTAVVGLSQAAQANPPSTPEAKSLYQKALGFVHKAGTAIVWAGATLGGVHGVLENGTEIAGLLGITDAGEGEVGGPAKK